MIAPKIKNSIIKYLSNEATSEDLDLLSEWITIGDNDLIFEKYVKLHYQTITAVNKPNVDKIKRNLIREIKRDKYPLSRRNVRIIFKYAAIGLLFLTLGYLYQERNMNNDLVPMEEPITIELGSGKITTIDPKGAGQVKDDNGNIIGIQKKTQLNYLGTKTLEKLTYNVLHVPYGKRFDVVLSDGTHVFLNSGSSLKYPIKFLKNSNRTVFLKGEAYFEVSKDKDHPFIVDVGDIDVKVLGTKFNISNYSEDSNLSTVLVEGSVELLKNYKLGSVDHPVLLKPGFMAEWDKANKEMSVENVDTRIYTAWVQGKLIFRNTSFGQIRKALERHYNVTIKNRNKDLDDQLFDATFDIETIQQVLESFSKSYAIDYRIVNNEVIIN